MKTSAFSLAGIDMAGVTPELLHQSAAELTPDERAVEEYLRHHKAWFPYRRLDHMDRTCEFVRVYDRIYLSMVDKNAEVKPKTRTWFKRRGHYLEPQTVMAPWAMVDKKTKVLDINPQWKFWLRSRRLADKLGMIYDDFVAGALFSTIRRGWSHWPSPNQYGSDKLLGQDPNDGYPDATIPGFERIKYAKSMKVTHDPYFSAIAWRECPIQLAYFRHFAGEVLRLKCGDQAARRAWNGYKSDGVIPAHLQFDELIL